MRQAQTLACQCATLPDESQKLDRVRADFHWVARRRCAGGGCGGGWGFSRPSTVCNLHGLQASSHSALHFRSMQSHDSVNICEPVGTHTKRCFLRGGPPSSYFSMLDRMSLPFRSIATSPLAACTYSTAIVRSPSRSSSCLHCALMSTIATTSPILLNKCMALSRNSGIGHVIHALGKFRTVRCLGSWRTICNVT